MQRLGHAVQQRRAQLSMSQVEVWRAGGPSNSTMTNIEGAKPLPVHPKTLRKLDTGLRWPPGTAYRILHQSSTAPGHTPEHRPHAAASETSTAVPFHLIDKLRHDAEHVRSSLDLFLDHQLELPVFLQRVRILADTASVVADTAGH